MSAIWWLRSLGEVQNIEDSWNFRHGDEVTLEGTCIRRATVHRPRWWNLMAHARWIIARARGRVGYLTMTSGVTLRLIHR